MVRGGKEMAAGGGEPNPEFEERKRLKKLAFKKGIVSEAPAKAFSVLSPSKIVAKHHGRDILRKSQRKNRFLFSFPGLLAPATGGKIGELKDLGTKNPILYLDFPQGQMKLFGTIFYPKNRYLTLQFSRGGKNVMCEDCFDTMIVFSDAWWIGRKEDNPQEAHLDFPKDLHEAQHVEYDFKGGAGATTDEKKALDKSGTKFMEPPKSDSEDDLSDGQCNLEDLGKVTPIRHSKRTTGKTFNFADASSGDDVGIDVGLSDRKKEIINPRRNYHSGEMENACPVVFKVDNAAASCSPFSAKVQLSATSVTKSKETSKSNSDTLVQTTLSRLFKKVEEKKLVSDEPGRVYRRKKITLDPGSNLQDAVTTLVEDDDIEEFSSTSKETDGSDEDWAA